MNNNKKAVNIIKALGILNPFSGHYEMATCYVNNENIACDFGGNPLSSKDLKELIETFK